MESQVTDMPIFADLANLSNEKLQQLESTVAFILASPAAQKIYAQLIDGRRTWQSYTDPETRGFCYKATPSSDHPNPSDEAMRLYEEIRTALTLQGLKLVKRYQNAPLNTREHDLHLLEMTAALVNTLAGLIYAVCHPDVELKPKAPTVEGEDFDPYFYRINQPYIDFYHPDYQAFRRYPFGLFNMVGYWAEAELFGGVLLFDRGESGLEINEAFIHPLSLSSACRLSRRQIADFMRLSESADAAHLQDSGNTLPFTAEPDAQLVDTRIVRERGKQIHIYKNDYDKQPVSYVPIRRHCCDVLDEAPIPFDETWRMIEEKGWNRLNPQSRQHVAIDNEELYLGYPSLTKEENPSGLSEYELLAKLCSDDGNAFE